LQSSQSPSACDVEVISDRTGLVAGCRWRPGLREPWTSPGGEFPCGDRTLGRRIGLAIRYQTRSIGGGRHYVVGSLRPWWHLV